MTAQEVIQQTEHKMGVTVEKLREDFTRIRTGRASTGLLDKIKVDYYGCPTPINQVAQVGVGDAHTLTVRYEHGPESEPSGPCAICYFIKGRP